VSNALVVTGADGWLGAAIVARARRVGAVVAVTRRGGPDDAAVTLTDAREVASFLDDVRPSAVINAAGRLNGDEDELWEANVTIVQVLLAATGPRGVPLVTIGSAAEYGEPADAQPLTEDTVARPTSEYGRSKLIATAAVRAAHTAGRPAVAARLFNVAGPGVAASRPLGELVTRVHALPAHGGVLVVDDAGTERDWVTSDFAVEALLALARRPTLYDIVNICSGSTTTMGALALALAHAEGRVAELEDRAAGRGPRRVVGDPGRLFEVTGRRSQFSPAGLAAAALADPDDGGRGQIT